MWLVQVPGFRQQSESESDIAKGNMTPLRIKIAHPHERARSTDHMNEWSVRRL